MEEEVKEVGNQVQGYYKCNLTTRIHQKESERNRDILLDAKNEKKKRS